MSFEFLGGSTVIWQFSRTHQEGVTIFDIVAYRHKESKVQFARYWWNNRHVEMKTAVFQHDVSHSQTLY